MPSLGGEIGMITYVSIIDRDSGGADIDQRNRIGLQVGESEETFKTWYKDHSTLELNYTKYLQHIFRKRYLIFLSVPKLTHPNSCE